MPHEGFLSLVKNDDTRVVGRVTDDVLSVSLRTNNLTRFDPLS